MVVSILPGAVKVLNRKNHEHADPRLMTNYEGSAERTDPRTERRDFSALRNEVIQTGLCTRCGGCVASCPVQCLTHGPEGIELSGHCIGCGICSGICPGRRVTIGPHEDRLFGRRHGFFNAIGGVVVERKDLEASDPSLLRSGHFGGRVTALLVHLLSTGRIDAAILTGWSDDGVLSRGSLRIARDPTGVMECSGSRYVFSPALSGLRTVEEDPSIARAAIVCLPCQVHALRNMEVDPRTSHLVRKVSLVIGLNCGGANLSEEGWKGLTSDILGIPAGSVRSARAYKVSGRSVKVEAVLRDGEISDRVIPFSDYGRAILGTGIWPRCMLCPDYSAYLSDISFGSPSARTARGKKALDDAISSGVLRASSRRRYAVQRGMDLYRGCYKVLGSKMRMARGRRNGRAVPEME